MTRILFASLAICAAFLTGCTTAEYAPSIAAKIYPVRTAPEAIALFRSAAPTRPFTEIGAVHACCASDPNDLISDLQKKASANGGDALLHLDMSPQGDVFAAVIRYQQ